MTECERLISEGIFDRNFFVEEIRNDFLIDVKRKKIWAIEIDLLLQLDKVCKKYDLQYYLMFGSLLGAIRHNGFIPWDDDIDVCMPRKDYEELLKIAPSEFQQPYFFQIPETDAGYYYTFAKLRNSNTAAFLDLFQYQKFNLGLLVDIFPMDVCKLNEVADNYREIQNLTRENTTYMRMSNPHLSAADKERVKNYSGGVPYDTYTKIQSIAMRHEKERDLYDKRIVAVFTGYSYKRMIYDAKSLSETVLHEFEGFQFPIPKGYHEILSRTYDDYMKLPPIQERGAWHSDYILDPDVSYIEYFDANIKKSLLNNYLR